MNSARAYLALGSNLGDREAALRLAREEIAALPGTVLRAVSAMEETLPLRGLAQPPYLNQMLALDTTLPPLRLLQACQRIEALAGRTRADRWASRVLDIDIVGYGTLRLEDPALVLPHPGLPEREFWRRELDQLHRAGW